MKLNRALLARLGLHPIAGFGVFAVDILLFGSEAATAFVSWPVSVAVAIALSFGVYQIQKRSYGDTPQAAFRKALAVGVLTAIPTAIPGLATATGGTMGALFLLLGGLGSEAPPKRVNAPQEPSR